MKLQNSWHQMELIVIILVYRKCNDKLKSRIIRWYCKKHKSVCKPGVDMASYRSSMKLDNAPASISTCLCTTVALWTSWKRYYDEAAD